MGQISKTELEQVKKAISDAEGGQATLLQLAQAEAVASRAGGGRTVGILRAHIRRMTPEATKSIAFSSFMLSITAGVVVWLGLGRLGKVTFQRRKIA